MRDRMRFIVVAALLLPLLDLPTAAQGLDLGLDLGDLELDLDLGDDGADLNLDLFGADLDVNTDLFGAPSGNGEPVFLTQDQALAAVTSRRALPLDKVMVIARLSTTGEIIDANLINVKGFLLYVFKVLETSGDVSELYFYARTGKMVQTR